LVERRDLVEQCVAQLVGDGDDTGHVFTLWAPRQTGKTWLMRRAIEEIRTRHGDQFTVGSLLMQGVVGRDDGEETFFRAMPRVFRDGFGFEPPAPADWEGWMRLFAVEGGAFDQPLILLIDEFDCLPPGLIDELVSRFRAMFLARSGYVLHGLALVGVLTFKRFFGCQENSGPPASVDRIPVLRSRKRCADPVSHRGFLGGELGAAQHELGEPLPALCV
jgi:hypothetical protein